MEIDKLAAFEAKRALEKKYAAEDLEEFQNKLAEAIATAANDSALRELLHWMGTLVPIGGHPTGILNAWGGAQYRKSHPPTFTQ